MARIDLQEVRRFVDNKLLGAVVLAKHGLPMLMQWSLSTSWSSSSYWAEVRTTPESMDHVVPPRSWRVVPGTTHYSILGTDAVARLVVPFIDADK